MARGRLLTNSGASPKSLLFGVLAVYYGFIFLLCLVLPAAVGSLLATDDSSINAQAAFLGILLLLSGTMLFALGVGSNLSWQIDKARGRLSSNLRLSRYSFLMLAGVLPALLGAYLGRTEDWKGFFLSAVLAVLVPVGLMGMMPLSDNEQRLWRPVVNGTGMSLIRFTIIFAVLSAQIRPIYSFPWMLLLLLPFAASVLGLFLLKKPKLLPGSSDKPDRHFIQLEVMLDSSALLVTSVIIMLTGGPASALGFLILSTLFAGIVLARLLQLALPGSGCPSGEAATSADT